VQSIRALRSDFQLFISSYISDVANQVTKTIPGFNFYLLPHSVVVNQVTKTIPAFGLLQYRVP
jgi:hypothetical protein